MSDLVQLIISALSQGLIYVLLALAYNITYSTSKTLNLSVGSLLMVGGVIGVSLTMDKATGTSYGRNYFIPVILVLIVGGILGALIYKVAIEQSIKLKLPFAAVLATLAVAGILRNFTERVWGTEDIKMFSPFGNEALRVFGFGVFPQELFIIFLGVAIVAGLEFFKKHSILGRAVQAVSEDAETASLMGINQKFIIVFSFCLSAALAALSGLIVGPITMVSPTMGMVIGIKAYAVSIIGGLQSGWGTLAGGMILALSELLTARYVSTGYKDMTGFLILVLIVLFRPNGLFGGAEGRKV